MGRRQREGQGAAPADGARSARGGRRPEPVPGFDAPTPSTDVDLTAIEHALGAAWLHAALDSTKSYIAVFDLDGTLRYVSPSVRVVLGYAPERLTGPVRADIVHPDDCERTRRTFAKVVAAPGRVVTLNVRARHRDGTWRWLESHIVNLVDHPAVQAVVASSWDVTDRREEREHAEAARQVSEARFRALAEHSSDILSVHGADGRLKYMSPSAERFFGVTLDEAVGGRSLHAFVHPEDRDVRDLTDLQKMNGTAPPRLVRVRNGHGDVRWLEAVTTNLLDDKNVQGLVTNGRDVTERVETTRVLLEAEQALRRSERRYRGIVEDQTELICRYQADATITFVNDAYARYFGASVDELIGTCWIEFIPEDDRKIAEAMINSLTSAKPVVMHEHRVVLPDGDIRWQQWTNRIVLDDEGHIAEYQSVGRDVTDRRLAEEAARASQRLLSDQARVLEAIARGAPLDKILGDLCRVVEVHVSGVHCSIQLVDEGGKSMDHGSAPARAERCWVTPIVSSVDGRTLGTFSISYDEPREPDARDREVVELVQDLAAIAIERKNYEAKLSHQAHHDQLTGLPNRTLFLEFLQLAMARSGRYRSTVSLLFLDLDRFKVVNDTLGHDAGDELLVALAQRLRGVVRPGDTVARFGGDEFTVLCEDLPTAGAGEHATDVAERLLRVIEQPFLLDGEEQYLSASIGIALAAPGVERPEALLRDADAAMYRAKARGNGRWELFDDAMRATALERLETENALHRALDRGELRVDYQPVVSLRDQRCVGAEALLRWAHPDRGLLTPSQFIDLAEVSGLIVPFGHWVIEDACRRLRRWRAEYGASFVVSVNLSGRQLSNPELARQVATALDHAGADPAGLRFEVTESVLMHDVEATIGAITSLKRLGVTLSIDDFGTGYSSLGHLKRFPVDAVKVDRSFIAGLGVDPERSAIVAAAVSLGHALGLTVIAEGVETDRQLSKLVDLGCDAAQGHLLARPAPDDDLAARVDRSRLARFAIPMD